MPSSSSLGSPHVGLTPRVRRPRPGRKGAASRAVSAAVPKRGWPKLARTLGRCEGNNASSMPRRRARAQVSAAHTAPLAPPVPTLCAEVPLIIQLEWEVELEVRPVARARVQDKLRQIEAAMCGAPPTCTGCGGGVDGSMLGMQVRAQRRRRLEGEVLPPLPPVEDGHFRRSRPGAAPAGGTHRVLAWPAVSDPEDPGDVSGRRRPDRRALSAKLFEVGWSGRAR